MPIPTKEGVSTPAPVREVYMPAPTTEVFMPAPRTKVSTLAPITEGMSTPTPMAKGNHRGLHASTYKAGILHANTKKGEDLYIPR